MPIGFHLSIAGGLQKAVKRAEILGCDAMQIFCRNPRSWKTGPVGPHDGDSNDDGNGDIKAFAVRRKEAALYPVVVHTSYLINLSSPDAALFKRSLKLFTFELELAGMLGVDYLVTHPGSHGAAGIDFAVDRVAGAIKEARKKTPRSKTGILIENTAGGGTQTGGDLEVIGRILEKTKTLKTGLCFDTCHGFVAGYPLKTAGEAASLVKTIDGAVGLKDLKLIHLNDSKGKFNSRLDRHEHIGKGYIGSTGIKAFITNRDIKAVPLILETPKDDDTSDSKNLRTVRRMQGAKRP